MFPWALVYDIPLETGCRYDDYNVCAFADDWYGEDAGKEIADVCPYDNAHRKNTVCPYGFWGIKHRIEQPPSLSADRSLPTVIDISRTPCKMIVALSEDLDTKISRDHLLRIASIFETHVAVEPYVSRQEFMDALETQPELELLYFYCHGRYDEDDLTDQRYPYLEIGKDERLTADDITAWRDEWSDDHWREIAPLVFLNGCHTVEITSESLVSFVEALYGARASGIVGTETSVHESIAIELAESFWKHFRPGGEFLNNSVGDSIRRARFDLLRKGNVMGFTYTAYCSVSLSFQTHD